MDERHHALAKLSAERWKIAMVLSGTMLLVYFGFILLIAFNKPLLGTMLAPGLSLGILLGAMVILAAWVLTLVYVRWANTVYDAKIEKLRK
jgi:uncharacterized membrane protein (DUF485 family)